MKLREKRRLSFENAKENGEQRKMKTASVHPISTPHQVMMLEGMRNEEPLPSSVMQIKPHPRKDHAFPLFSPFYNLTEFLFSFQDGGWTLVTETDLITRDLTEKLGHRVNGHLSAREVDGVVRRWRKVES